MRRFSTLPSSLSRTLVGALLFLWLTASAETVAIFAQGEVANSTVKVVASDAVPVSQKHKSVLLLFSEESNLYAQVVAERAIRSTLTKGSPVPLEVYSEYLDFMRTPVNDYQKELADLLRRKYEGRKFDLIMAILPTALGVMLKNQSELFPDTPVVFFVIDHRNVAGLNLPPNVTGVWGEMNFKPNLDLALKLHPKTRKVVVLVGVSEFDNYWTAIVRKDFLPYEGKLEITYLSGLTIPEQQQALSSLAQNTIVFFVSATRDKAGNNYDNPSVLSQISPASSAPIYGTTDAHLGSGIVGGSIFSFEALGVETAGVGLRILAGEQPQAIAPYGIRNVDMFDWRELRRWGISERSLPPASVVRFRQPSFWDSYKWHIVGVLALCALQALLIAFLLFERGRRRRALIELDKRVRFETLLSKLSADFTNLPPNKVDALVKQWLERLQDFLGDATILFFEVPKIDGEVVSSSSPKRPHALAVGAVKEDEWCRDQLRRGLTIDLANMLAGSSIEKIGENQKADLKSLLAIPVSVHGTTYALALETTKSHRVWPKDLEPQFRLIGEIFAGALERKRAGEELRKTRTDLAHVARLTAMGEMAASIAHEVNQPLTAIATYGDACALLLSGESPNVKKSLEAIDHIVKESIRASEVVKRIRGLVKKTSHETAPQDLNQIIREMLAVTEADLSSRSIQLELSLAPELPSVLGDSVELQQVVLNLILNSIEAMSEVTDRARELKITSSMNGGGVVVVSVQDSGVGLNSEQTQRIFDPFVTTKQSGLGLGLSISRTILEGHGGRLWAEPNKGPGAKFQFTIPTVTGGDNGP